MKVKIDEDELYPYYVIDKDVVEGYGKEVEILEEKLKRYKKILKEFLKMQEELEELYENAEGEEKYG